MIRPEDSKQMEATLIQLMDEASDGWASFLREGGQLSDVLGFTSNELEALYTLGHGFYAQERYHDAFKVFSALMTYSHLEPRYAKALASTAKMIGRYEDALRQYMFVVVAEPLDPAPLYHCAECLIHLGKTEEAIEALELVLTMCASAPKPEYVALVGRATALMQGQLAASKQ